MKVAVVELWANLEVEQSHSELPNFKDYSKNNGHRT